MSEDFTIWERSNGKRLPVVAMKDGHIKNALAALRKKIDMRRRCSLIDKENNPFWDTFAAEVAYLEEWERTLAAEWEKRCITINDRVLKPATGDE